MSVHDWFISIRLYVSDKAVISLAICRKKGKNSDWVASSPLYAETVRFGRLKRQYGSNFILFPDGLFGSTRLGCLLVNKPVI